MKPPNLDKQIGQRIKTLRKAYGFSQAEFGHVLRVGKSHISKIEAGKNQPSELLVLAICWKWEVREEWLRYGDTVFKEEDGFSAEQLERMELGFAPNRDCQPSLIKRLDKYQEITLQMIDEIAGLHKAISESVEPIQILLKKKSELIESLSVLEHQINSLFHRIATKIKGNRSVSSAPTIRRPPRAHAK